MSNRYEQRIGIGVDAELRDKWGASYDRHLESAQAVTDNLGAETIVALEEEIGTRALLEGAVAIGTHLRMGTVLEPDVAEAALRAHAELQRMKSNPEFMRLYMGGDHHAREVMERAYQLAHPTPVEDEP